MNEDDVISEHWSAMTCAQTPPAPELTVLPGAAGRGTEGSGAPPLALVEWRGSTGGNTGWYEVQTWTERSAVWRTARRQGPNETEVEATRVWPRDGELEAPFALEPGAQAESGQVPTFRVCAVNVAGQTCGETRRLAVRVFSNAAVNAALKSHVGIAVAAGAALDAGTAWNRFTHIVSAGEGIVYGIDADGNLVWHRHAGWRNGGGAETWSGPRLISGGWGAYSHVFSGGWTGVQHAFSPGDGIIYLVQADGALVRYLYPDYIVGAMPGRTMGGGLTARRLEGSVLLQSGWGVYPQVFTLLP